MLKRCGVIFFIAVTLMLFGCSNHIEKNTPSSTKIIEPTYTKTAKTEKPVKSLIPSDDYSDWLQSSENISIGGRYMDDNLIIENNYIILHENDLYSIDVKTKEKHNIDTVCKYVQIYKQYIYYNKNNSICRVKYDGTCKETVFQANDGKVSKFSIVNDTIYYLFFNKQKKNAANSQKWELCSIDLNGQNPTLLQNCVDGYLLWNDKDHIYYIDVKNHQNDIDTDAGTFMMYDISEYDIIESKINTVINDGFDLDIYPVKYGQKFYYNVWGEEQVEYDLESGIQKDSLKDTYILDIGTQYYQWVLYFNGEGQSIDALDLSTNRTEKVVDLPEEQIGIGIFSDKNTIVFNTIDKEKDYLYSLELIDGVFVSKLIYDFDR